MAIEHHFTDDFLIDYASGALGESWSLAVATHLALCPACRAVVDEAEALGGAFLEDLEPIPLLGDMTEQGLDQDAAPLTPKTKATKPSRDIVFPQPLRDWAGGDLDTVKWTPIGGGIRQKLFDSSDGATARLLYIPAGCSVPEHGHNGNEVTLVLSGGIDDGGQSYRRGDVEITDGDIQHKPKAMDDGPCICLAVTDAPLNFTSLIPRLLQRFIRI